MKKILFLFLIYLLTACAGPEQRNTTNDTISSESSIDSSFFKDIPGRKLIDSFSVIGDSIMIPEFEIELSLSPKAEAKLKTDKESIIVSSVFNGIPKDTTLPDYIEWGKIYIADKAIELNNKKVARFEHIKLSKEDFDSLADKDFEVLINVFSGRRASKFNILDSDFLQEGIETVKGKRYVLKVKLIEGE